MRCPSCASTVSYGVLSCESCGATFTVAAEPAPLDRPAPSLPPVVRRMAVVRLADWLAGVLVLDAAALLVWAIVPGSPAVGAISILSSLFYLASGILMLVWIRRARMNVAGRAEQPLRQGWAIWGWICPVVNFWFPLLIVSAIDNTDLRPERRVRAMRLRAVWWACWLLSWVVGFRILHTATVLRDGSVFYGTSIDLNPENTVLSRLIAAAAAILLAIIVRGISARQERALREGR